MQNKVHGENEAEFAILVTDQYQRKGLCTELLRRLIQFGLAEKLQCLTGTILTENKSMQEVCKKLGFRLQYSPEEHLMSAELEL